MTQVGELVQRLEGLWLDPATASVEQLATMLAERQKILGQLQNTDTRGLGPESKAALQKRIEEVRRRDQKLLAALTEQRQMLEEELSGLMRGRAAARGYGGQAAGAPAVFDREG